LLVVSAKSIKCRSRPSHSLWSAIKQDFNDNAWLQLGPHPKSSMDVTFHAKPPHMCIVSSSSPSGTTACQEGDLWWWWHPFDNT
jgi:hypothetical protein